VFGRFTEEDRRSQLVTIGRKALPAATATKCLAVFDDAKALAGPPPGDKNTLREQLIDDVVSYCTETGKWEGVESFVKRFNKSHMAVSEAARIAASRGLLAVSKTTSNGPVYRAVDLDDDDDGDEDIED
jgi:hypothetical protein